MRKYLWVIILNSVCAFFYISYYASYSMSYCGKIEEKKPILAFGISPKWFDKRFQFNIGNKEITSSKSNSRKKSFDKWVKGNELFKTITAYDISHNDTSLFFKALNWDNVEKVFILQEYTSIDDEDYVYEIIVSKEMGFDHEWVYVDNFSCRIGVYGYLVYLILFFTLILNFLIFLRKK